MNKNFDKWLINWEEFFTPPLNVTSNYPPYNIYNMFEPNSTQKCFVLELAVAGFKREELSVDLVGDILKISGHVNPSEEAVTFIHQGLSRRAFTREFKLPDITVSKVTLENGILSVLVSQKQKESTNLEIEVV